MGPAHFEWDPDKDSENQAKHGVLTVRFTYRQHRIRIIGAGYWRKGRAVYEAQNQIH